MARNKANDDNSSDVVVRHTEKVADTCVAERFPSGCLQITVDTPPQQWPTSLVIGSSKWKAAVVNSTCTPDVQVGAEWSEPFLVTDWLVMVRESVDDKTGEIRRYPWLSLICADGGIVGTSSDIVPHQLARILREYSTDEWAKGVAMKIRRRPSRNGLTSYHELRVVE